MTSGSAVSRVAELDQVGARHPRLAVEPRHVVLVAEPHLQRVAGELARPRRACACPPCSRCSDPVAADDGAAEQDPAVDRVGGGGHRILAGLAGSRIALPRRSASLIVPGTAISLHLRRRQRRERAADDPERGRARACLAIRSVQRVRRRLGDHDLVAEVIGERERQHVLVVQVERGRVAARGSPGRRSRRRPAGSPRRPRRRGSRRS